MFQGSPSLSLPVRSSDSRSRVEQLIRGIFSKQRRNSIDDALSIARSWMPSGEFYSYREEMQNRVLYFLGSMQADMRSVLKRRFPQRHEDLERDQLNLRIVRRLVLNRAKVFTDQGRFHLETDAGDEIDPSSPDAKAFDEMMRLMGAQVCLRDADAYTQLCHRCAFKLWWDRNRRCVRVSVYPPHQVYLVPDPDIEWDADACWAQLFERPGSAGLVSRSRYEVWGIRDPMAAQTTGYETIHYVSDGENDYKVNDNDVNPFVDPLTGKPMYPSVWWQDDTVAALYVLGAEDLLTINRCVNAGLTDLANNIHFQSFGVPVYTVQAGSGVEPPAKRTLSPSDAVDLPPGVGLEFKSPGLMVEPVADFWQLLVRLEALIDGQSPNAVRVDGQEAASGYALRIENLPLHEHRAQLAEIYRPQVEESIRRAIVVWNTYAADYGRPIIAEGLVPRWEPGEISYPVDEEQVGRVYSTEILGNVSTAVDWRMARYGEDRERAEQVVRENAEFNADLAKLGVVSIGSDLSQYMSGQPVGTSDAEDAEDVEDAEKAQAPEDSTSEGSGVEDATADKLVANVYQIVKAIEIGAATAVDLRMLLYPGETRAQAEAMVRYNAEFNKEMAELNAQAQLAQERVLAEGSDMSATDDGSDDGNPPPDESGIEEDVEE